MTKAPPELKKRFHVKGAHLSTSEGLGLSFRSLGDDWEPFIRALSRCFSLDDIHQIFKESARTIEHEQAILIRKKPVLVIQFSDNSSRKKKLFIFIR